MRLDAEKGRRAKRTAGWLLAGVVALAAFSSPVRELAALPESLTVTVGYRTTIRMTLPCGAHGSDETIAASSAMGGARGIAIEGNGEGTALITFRLFDILPIKRVRVSVEPEKRLVPGGACVGVALRTEGVLLVGTSDVGAFESPARLAGLRSGDTIVAVNGQKIEGAAELTALIGTSGGREVTLSVFREDERFDKAVRPMRDPRDGLYRLGAWVRDSTAGVGTLSFIDPETGVFGALGHAISDADTQTRMRISEGCIYKSSVADVRKGVSGTPGELVGSFFSQESALGEIDRNTPFGIYGRYSGDMPASSIPILTRGEARLGPAVLLSEVDEGGVREYACEITRLSPQDAPAQRGIVVRVTDPELLSKTGGIVQGMSGSPILQNGRLVGAVTHVFVNDPTQGYGMYIEWMLETAYAQ